MHLKHISESIIINIINNMNQLAQAIVNPHHIGIIERESNVHRPLLDLEAIGELEGKPTKILVILNETGKCMRPKAHQIVHANLGLDRASDLLGVEGSLGGVRAWSL